jgi:RNA-directed DNA polymerase
MKDYFKKSSLTEAYNEKFSNVKSKGLDKVSSLMFEEKLGTEITLINSKVLSGNYTFSPYLEKLIIKDRFSPPRLLSIPTIRDRIVLYQLKELLHSKLPHAVSKTRPQNLVEEIIDILNTAKYDYCIRTDLKKFYDNVNRDKLIKRIKKEEISDLSISLIEKAINNTTVPINYERTSFNKYYQRKGIPQGLSISNCLAQVYMLDFDIALNGTEYFYVRYVDDIFILCKKTQSASVRRLLNEELKKLGLELNAGKTKCGKLEKQFEFLGYKFENQSIAIAEKNIQKKINAIASKFTWFKNGWSNNDIRPEHLKNDDEKFKARFIDELNNIITGVIINKQKRSFLDYYREITDLSVLFRLDNIVKRFFDKTKPFNEKPSEVKSFVRAFYEIKCNKTTNYILNLDKINDIEEKRKLLVKFGYLHLYTKYADEQIENMFKRYKFVQLKYNNKSEINYY